MAIADHIPPPEFVELGATPAGGLDLMGLRLPVQAVGSLLLNGITTITPTVRYLSFRTWLIYRYAHSEPPPENRFESFTRFASHAEAVFALSNLLRDRSTLGLIGARKAGQMLDEGNDPLGIERLTKQLAISIYGNPSDQLRLTRARDPMIPEIGQEHGVPLVLAVEEAMGSTAIGALLQRAEPLKQATRAELEEFARATFVLAIPEAERQALIGAILPLEPEEDERRRLATFAALLALGDQLPPGESLTEDHLFDEAVRPERALPRPLHQILDGWLLYSVRDALAVTGEYALAAIVRRLQMVDQERVGIGTARLVRRLVEDSINDQESALREIGLLEADDDLGTIQFSALEQRLVDKTREIRLERDVRRWDGPLTEPNLYRAIPGLGDGSLALGVLSWMMAERRAGPTLKSKAGGSLPGLEVIASPGTARFGLPEVIIPHLEDWRKRALPMPAVLQEFALIVIDQHLRIAWSRMAQDPRRDVSVLSRDGHRLMLASDFWPGRPASRLPQAIGWLEQLALMEDGRTTDEGRVVLARLLGALS
jgi:hypothetical protein